MATKKTTTSKKVETKKCLICGEDKSCSSSNNKFYKHWNKYYSDDVGFCKQCVEEVGLTNDIKEIHRLLRMMDMPFLPDKWNDCTSEENTLTSYISSGKGLNNPKTNINGVKIVDMRYEDSPTCEQIEDVDIYLISSDQEKLENISKWEEHYSQAEYIKLNASVENNIKVTGRDDYQSIKNFERVARAEIERDRAYSNQSLKPNDKKSAEDNVTNMMKQAGLSYEQSARNTDGTLGTDIRDVLENYDPVGEASDEFKDVDSISKYIFRFLTKPMMRALGKDSSNTKDDYEEVRREIKARQDKYGGDSCDN